MTRSEPSLWVSVSGVVRVQVRRWNSPLGSRVAVWSSGSAAVQSGASAMPAVRVSPVPPLASSWRATGWRGRSGAYRCRALEPGVGSSTRGALAWRWGMPATRSTSSGGVVGEAAGACTITVRVAVTGSTRWSVTSMVKVWAPGGTRTQPRSGWLTRSSSSSCTVSGTFQVAWNPTDAQLGVATSRTRRAVSGATGAGIVGSTSSTLTRWPESVTQLTTTATCGSSGATAWTSSPSKVPVSSIGSKRSTKPCTRAMPDQVPTSSGSPIKMPSSWRITPSKVPSLGVPVRSSRLSGSISLDRSSMTSSQATPTKFRVGPSRKWGGLKRADGKRGSAPPLAPVKSADRSLSPSPRRTTVRPGPSRRTGASARLGTRWT